MGRGNEDSQWEAGCGAMQGVYAKKRLVEGRGDRLACLAMWGCRRQAKLWDLRLYVWAIGSDFIGSDCFL